MSETGPGDHLCLTFGGEEEREHVVGAFARAGLEAGDRLLYVADATEPTGVLQLLRRQAVDPEPLLRSGRLVVETAEELYLQQGRFDPEGAVSALLAAVASARADGCRALRATVEMGWALRGVPGSKHLLEFEGRLRSVLATGPSMMICQYDRRIFQTAALANVARMHQAAVTVDADHDDGLLRITRTFQPPGLRVVGEVDATSVPALERALAAAVEREAGDVQVDLGCLEFIDLAGLRAIVAAAERMEAGRALVMHPMRPHLRRLILLLGWDETPGLRLGDDPA